MDNTGVLLVDWENLSGSIVSQKKLVEASHVSDVWRFAQEVSGGRLQHAHMAAAQFDPSIKVKMREHLIELEQVETQKEQADITLTVLAMDYLHAGIRNFILVTGDQDFIPLISRLHSAGCRVTLVYGDESRLSSTLRKAMTTPGLDSRSISDICVLRERQMSAGCRDVIGLLELQRRGMILGGREKGERLALLHQWGVLENLDEATYWALIEAAGRKEVRRGTARREGDSWLPMNATRTLINVSSERLANITAADYFVRFLSAHQNGAPIAQLRVGPFAGDDGSLLDRIVDALGALELVRKGASGMFALVESSMQLGYFEQLWRVYGGLLSECYRRETESIPYGQLESLLVNGGIGQGKDQRASSRVRESIDYARAAGVIDSVAVAGKRHVRAHAMHVCKPFESAYADLYRSMSNDIGKAVTQQDVIEMMKSKARQDGAPIYGYDDRDRYRLLRIMHQSRLVKWAGGGVTVSPSRWGDSLVQLRTRKS